MTFNSLGLVAPLVHNLAARAIVQPTPIQLQAIPAVLQGRDVLAVAPTGSGKTVSYALPLLQKLHGSSSKNRTLQALVLVPTRELAVQVYKVFLTYTKSFEQPPVIRTVYGGVSINPQMQLMNRVDLLVATPGRLLELVSKNAVLLNELRILVLDEADKMLSLGFEEEVREVLTHLPKKRQNLLFSATLAHQITALQTALLKNPVTINLARETQTDLELITQEAYRVTAAKKGLLLRHLIQERNLEQVLIFCSSTYQVEHVNDKLNKHGIVSKAIHSKKAQGTRQKNLADFKNGTATGVRCLVTTDLLARGIDIAFLPTVINYELPRSPQDFIHRIGRTGRAENPGNAITLVTPDDAHHWRVIQKKIIQKIWTEDTPAWNS